MFPEPLTPRSPFSGVRRRWGYFDLFHGRFWNLALDMLRQVSPAFFRFPCISPFEPGVCIYSSVRPNSRTVIIPLFLFPFPFRASSSMLRPIIHLFQTVHFIIQIRVVSEGSMTI